MNLLLASFVFVTGMIFMILGGLGLIIGSSPDVIGRLLGIGLFCALSPFIFGIKRNRKVKK